MTGLRRGWGMGRARLAPLQASLVSFSTQLSYEVLDRSKRQGRYCGSTKFSFITWVKAVFRTHVEMLLHDKITCVHWYGLFIVCRCNNNSVPCWKYCSYMGDPSPRFPLPACLLHSQWLVVCSAAINSFRIISIIISIIINIKHYC